jgi:hypothetical protein
MGGSRRIPQAHGGLIVLPVKGESGNPNGRPRKLVADVINDLKAKGITPVKPHQIIEAYEALLNSPEEDIVATVNNKDLPYFIRLVASAMTSKGKGFEIIERMIDRAHGKATFKADVTSGGNSFLDLIKKASGGKGK